MRFNQDSESRSAARRLGRTTSARRCTHLKPGQLVERVLLVVHLLRVERGNIVGLLVRDSGVFEDEADSLAFAADGEVCERESRGALVVGR